MVRFGESPGIVVEGEPGQSVWASRNGHVRSATYEPKFGYMIVLDHDDEESTFYAGIDGICVSVGDEVKAGAPIAILGVKGFRGRKAGVYFEIRRQDESIDPLKFLPTATQGSH